MSPLAKITLSLLAAGMTATVVVPAANAQANCEMYGKLALKQMQENEQKKCGLKGAEWNSDLKAHVTWCATVPPDQWKIQLQKREQALGACAKKP
ncbi:MAG: hypothetical protein ABL904_08090 [Hyphomicrobiaceae bacterium]